MHQTGHFAPMLRLDRHHEAAAADGDNGLLQCLLIRRRAHQLIQLIPHLGRGGPHLAANIRQRGGCVIRHLFLIEHHRGYLLFDVFIGHQHRKAVVQTGGHPLAVGAPLTDGADDAQRIRNAQQFTQRQAGARLGAAQRIAHVGELTEGGTAEARHQAAGVVGLVQQALYQRRLGHGAQRARHIRRRSTAGLRRQQIQYFIQF